MALKCSPKSIIEFRLSWLLYWILSKRRIKKSRINISLHTKEFLGFEKLQERDKEKVSLDGEKLLYF